MVTKVAEIGHFEKITGQMLKILEPKCVSGIDFKRVDSRELSHYFNLEAMLYAVVFIFS